MSDHHWQEGKDKIFANKVGHIGLMTLISVSERMLNIAVMLQNLTVLIVLVNGEKIEHNNALLHHSTFCLF